MSLQWMTLVRQLCTPSQQLAVSAIASARSGGDRTVAATPADAARLARRFGMASAEAEAWARGSAAAVVLDWPRSVLELVEPVGLFEEIALDEAVGVLDRLALLMAESDSLDRQRRVEPALAS